MMLDVIINLMQNAKNKILLIGYELRNYDS